MPSALDAAEAALEEELSRPFAEVAETVAAVPGDLLVLGAGGKMGPTLARMARRAADEAGVPRRVIAVARFTDPRVRSLLEGHGVETLAADLLDPAAVAALPDAANVILMAGQKFGSAEDPATTWAVNVHLPGLVADRFLRCRLVAYSTGNVYPLWPADSRGPREADPVGPVGEYAQSALGRERVLSYAARRDGTPMAILRLNYANEPRYGVLRDLADRIVAGQPIDLGMSRVNLIWQRDANAAALRALAHAEVPPLILNLTGTEPIPVRRLAELLGERLGRRPVFAGLEGPTALLSDAARAAELLGPPPTALSTMIERVADWVRAGGRSLDKPTHFEERDGRF